MEKDTFYLTTPIYYVNRKPHLGTVYSTVAADVLARFKRMQGKDVFFLTGSNEHGEKIAMTALKEGKEPKEWVDEMVAQYKLLWDRLEISYNNFIRTTDEKHFEVVKKVLEILKEKNLIYQGVYIGLYCLECERYYTEKELVNHHCPFHPQKKIISLEEKCYFFKLGTFHDALFKLIEKGELKIEPEKRRNEVLGFLKTEKLEDLAISRQKVKWGVPLPFDLSQTIYVWVDALLNYLSGLNWQENFKKIPKYWPPDCQILGKDILRFHSFLWPALLLALELPLPRLLFVHGFLTQEGQKMSKSVGNIIEPDKSIEVFGSEATRYLLLSATSFGEDGDISLSKFYDVYNAELANGFGNLLSRVLALAYEKEFKFKENEEVKEKLEAIWQRYEENMEKLKFNHSLEIFQNLISFADLKINKKEPWKLEKNNPEEFKEVIYSLLEILRHLSLMIMPYLPEKSVEALEVLGAGGELKKSLKEAQQYGGIKIYKISKKLGKIFPRL